jgi:WD40 repeat protein
MFIIIEARPLPWLLHTLQVADGTIFSGSFDNSIKVWDMATGSCLQTLTGHTDVIWGVQGTAQERTTPVIGVCVVCERSPMHRDR